MSCCIKNNSVRRVHFLMNTFCSIQAEGEDNALVEASIEEAFYEIKRLERLFSRHLEESEISKINREAADSQVLVTQEVFQLVARAQELSWKTYGAFDISLGAIIDFWRLSESKNLLSSQKEIQGLKSSFGYKSITLDFDKKSIHFERRGLKIDLGALAKGYALDRVVAVLRNKQIFHAEVNLGGNIYALNNEPQQVGIRSPIADDKVIATASLLNTSISTSANYERNFTIRNRKFGHLLNPFTGYPADSDILSVSVVSREAALADALSTAIFVLGFDKAKQLLKNFGGVEAIIILKAVFINRLKVFQLKGGL